MSSSLRLRLRRERLWRRNPCCYWCGQPTVLMKGRNGPVPPNMATIDHLRCRLHPGRLEPNPQHQPRTVLSCWKCNNERGSVEQKEAGLHEIRRRSGTSPLSHHLARILHWYKHGDAEQSNPAHDGLVKICETWLKGIGISSADDPKDLQAIQAFISDAYRRPSSSACPTTAPSQTQIQPANLPSAES